MSAAQDYGFVDFDSVKTKGDEFGFVSFQSTEPPDSVKEEPWYKEAIRKAYQPLSGIINATPIPLALDVMSMTAQGESLNELEELKERYPELKEKFPFANWPKDGLDEEKYMEALRNATETFPTQRNIERGIEETTGLPLTPKSRTDELLRLGGMGGKFASAAGASTKGAIGAGVAVPAAAEAGKAVGIPEPFADLVALGLSKPLSKGAEILPSLGKKTKPSGLTARRYEKLTSPKEVSAKTKAKITEKTEGEFRDITSKLIQEGEGAKTYNALKDDKTFKTSVQNLFPEVERLAGEFPEPIPTMKIKQGLATRRPEKGFVSSEYDKAYQAAKKAMIKDITAENVSAQQLVQQYRKNNMELGEYYDPSKSRAMNRARKDALVDFNREIADVMKTEYPNSEFAELFEFTNKRWSQIKDAEFVDKFMDDLFNGKINYKKGEELLQRENAQFPFKRMLGEEGYKHFEQLTKDLMTTEQANKMLKVAEKKGLGDVLKGMTNYLIHPSFLKLKFGANIVKGAWESLLDKPQLAVKWDEGIKHFKAGKFAEAAKSFEALEKEINVPKEAVEVQAAEKVATPKGETIEGKAEAIKEPVKALTHQTKVKPIYEMSSTEIEKQLKDLYEYERSILEPKVGKKAYDEEYRNRGFEGQRKFWEKYEDRFSESELYKFENYPYVAEDLRARLDQTRDIRTSYNVGYTPNESLTNVIGELRNALINPEKPANQSFIREGFDYLRKKGHTKQEIAEAVFKIMRKDLNINDAQYILEDLFKKVSKNP